MRYQNPIIPGYNPDPTICRVGEDYYIMNSSFEFFPGVPIYHSRNLANWTLKGYCLTRESQVNLNGCHPSGGIYAPTLRSHNGRFYMTTTNVTHGGNFIVTSDDILGEWSEPVWVDQEGIDPSLLFDDDGKVYYCTAVFEPEREGIYLSEINPDTGEKLTETVCITKGCGGRYAEGPHMYKLWGKYYLMLAEGGTEYGHYETMMRASSPYGPFEQCPHNPILSHVNRMKDDIQCTGHADIVEDHNHNWWMVCLGIRQTMVPSNRVLLHNLGRETFLAPVVWTKDGWPVVGYDGSIELDMDGPLPSEACKTDWSFFDDFSSEEPSSQYNYIRNPVAENYQRLPKERVLRLTGTDMTLSHCASPTFLGVRQREFETITTVTLSADCKDNHQCAGLTAFYNQDYHYDILLTKQDGQDRICLRKQVHDILTITASHAISYAGSVELQIISDRKDYRFLYRVDDGEFIELGRGCVAGLCTEGTQTMSFTGTYLGMFSENTVADFRLFRAQII